MRASPVNTYWYKKLIKHRDTETREKAQRKISSLLCGLSASPVAVVHYRLHHNIWQVWAITR